MQLIDLLLKRRSYRKYQNTKINREKIEAILDAGLLYFSGKNTRPCEFIVVEDEENLEKLSNLRPSARMLKGASCAIIVCAKNISDTWIEDSSIAMAYMHLMAENEDVGACWIQIRNRVENGISVEDKLRDMMELGEDYRILAILSLGLKDEVKQAHTINEINRKIRYFNKK